MFTRVHPVLSLPVALERLTYTESMIRPIKIFVSLSIAGFLGLAACNPVSTLNALTLTRGLGVDQNVKYGPLERQALDIYRPISAKNAPMVVFVHGGSWTSSGKEDHKFVGESLAREGIVTLVINYRLFPKVVYPAFTEDTVLALRWAKDHALELGANPAQIYAMGHSAGAFNVADAIVDRAKLKAQNLEPLDFAGVIGIAGPYDYDYNTSYTKNVFNPLPLEKVMPARKVTPGLPPFLLLVGENDTTVEPQNGLSMRSSLEQNNSPVKYVTIPGANHLTILGAVGRRVTFLGSEVRPEILSFIKSGGKVK